MNLYNPQCADYSNLMPHRTDCKIEQTFEYCESCKRFHDMWGHNKVLACTNQNDRRKTSQPEKKEQRDNMSVKQSWKKKPATKKTVVSNPKYVTVLGKQESTFTLKTTGSELGPSKEQELKVTVVHMGLHSKSSQNQFIEMQAQDEWGGDVTIVMNLGVLQDALDRLTF